MLRWVFKIISLLCICFYLTSCGFSSPKKTKEFEKLLKEKTHVEFSVKPLKKIEVTPTGAWWDCYDWVYLIESKEDSQCLFTFVGYPSDNSVEEEKLDKVIQSIKIKHELEKDFKIDFYGYYKENSYLNLSVNYLQQDKYEQSLVDNFTIKEMVTNSDNFKNGKLLLSIDITRFVSVNNEIIDKEFNYINKLITDLRTVDKNAYIDITFFYYDEKYKKDFIKTTRSGDNWFTGVGKNVESKKYFLSNKFAIELFAQENSNPVEDFANELKRGLSIK